MGESAPQVRTRPFKIFSTLVAELAPSTVVWRSPDNAVWRAEEMLKQIDMGTTVAREYATELTVSTVEVLPGSFTPELLSKVDVCASLMPLFVEYFEMQPSDAVMYAEGSQAITAIDFANGLKVRNPDCTGYILQALRIVRGMLLRRFNG